MKKKKLVLALVLAFGVLTLYSGSARAADGFYTCVLTKAGFNQWGQGYVVATEVEQGGLFTDRLFQAVSGRDKEMLAVALTAIAVGTNVEIKADLAEASPTTLKRIMMLP